MAPANSPKNPITICSDVRHGNASSACDVSFPDLPRLDAGSPTAEVEPVNTEDALVGLSQNNDMLTWSTEPHIKLLRLRKFWTSICEVYPKFKRILRRQPDPNYVKVAYSVAKLQEHSRDLSSENKRTLEYVDELKSTLKDERLRFQQQLESQRESFQEREKYLIEQLLFGTSQVKCNDDS